MSGLETNIASQIGDVVRPVQQQNVIREQRAASEARERESVEASSSISADDAKSTLEELKQVVEASSGRRLEFNVMQDDARLSYVEVYDRDSDELIRQIPYEEVLKIRSHLNDIVGMMVDKLA